MCSECPSDATLKLFADGLLTEQFEDVDNHVGQCERCAAIISGLGSLDGQDRFAKAFREAASVRGLNAFASGDCVGRDRELLVIRKIGQGGMAQVWQAYQQNLDRFVAIKVALTDWQFSESPLQCEAKASASIHHPNIVSIHDYLRINHQPAIVMDFVDGETLSQRLRGRRCGDRLLASWACQLAEAVDHLHHAKIVHGDLKPSNLLIDQRDRLLVSDFGISSSSSRMSQHTLAGTPGYWAPEKSDGKIGPMNDIYSIGCILMDLARHSDEHTNNAISGGPAGASKTNASFGNRLRAIARDCLNEQPELRIANCHVLVKRLTAITPQSTTHRTRLSLMSLAIASLLLACVSLIGLSFLGGTNWFSRSPGINAVHPSQANTHRIVAVEPDPGRVLAADFFRIIGRDGRIHLRNSPSRQHGQQIVETYPNDQPMVITGFTIQPFTAEQFERLKPLLETETIELLSANSGSLSLSDCQFLASLANLKLLYTTDVRMSEKSLVQICQSRSINTLGLHDELISDQVVDALLSMKQLGTLWLSHCPLTSDRLARLATHPSLRTLRDTQDHGLPKEAIDKFRSESGLLFRIDESSGRSTVQLDD
ncbi:MAG: serine/threonine-protein kinase [Planctomycetota bacterium]